MASSASANASDGHGSQSVSQSLSHRVVGAVLKKGVAAHGTSPHSTMGATAPNPDNKLFAVERPPVVAFVAAAAIGVTSTAQAAVNTALGRALGAPSYGAFAAYCVGVSVLLISAAVHARARGIALFTFPRRRPALWELAGGACGAAYMLTAVTLTPVLGVELFFSLVVVGQLGASLALDHIGFVGMPVSLATPAKICALFIALGGVALAATEGAEVTADEFGSTGVLNIPGDAAHPAAHEAHISAASFAVYAAAGAAAGALQPLQAAFNWRLAALLPHKGQAVAMSVAIAGVVAAVVAISAAATGAAPPPAHALRAAFTRTEWWMWMGAACTIANVSGGVVLPARLTSSVYYMLLLLGELLASVALDHAGALGLAVRPATPRRVAGIALVCAGAVLMNSSEAIERSLRPYLSAANRLGGFTFFSSSGLRPALAPVQKPRDRAADGNEQGDADAPEISGSDPCNVDVLPAHGDPASAHSASTHSDADGSADVEGEALHIVSSDLELTIAPPASSLTAVSIPGAQSQGTQRGTRRELNVAHQVDDRGRQWAPGVVRGPKRNSSPVPRSFGSAVDGTVPMPAPLVDAHASVSALESLQGPYLRHPPRDDKVAIDDDDASGVADIRPRNFGSISMFLGVGSRLLAQLTSPRRTAATAAAGGSPAIALVPVSVVAAPSPTTSRGDFSSGTVASPPRDSRRRSRSPSYSGHATYGAADARIGV